ncbi:MAG: hypothetical protein ACREGD_03805 [Candidatus Saccharimonadales bacterium]
MKTTEITREEINQLVYLMKKLKPGFLPPEVFIEWARIGVAPILEVVPLRLRPDGKPEVLLTKRQEDDPIWPSQLHTPGTVIRATDTEGGDYPDAFKRVLEGELEGMGLVGQPVYVQNFLHHSGRGMESSMVFFVEVAESETDGRFYPVYNLPSNAVQTQIDFIKIAASAFLASKQNG